MGVRIYKISEYEHAAEIRQFDALFRILGELETQTGGEYVLVGNYNIEGVELDALLFTPQAALVIEFKNWGGSIVAGENGPWTSDGRTIAGGAYGKSPSHRHGSTEAELPQDCANISDVSASKWEWWSCSAGMRRSTPRASRRV